jgi:hypothetical protein
MLREKSGPQTEKVTGLCRKSHQELHNSPNIIEVIKLRMRRARKKR